MLTGKNPKPKQRADNTIHIQREKKLLKNEKHTWNFSFSDL